jgi:RimJ/RimL family protein N-acetyltransferase
VDPAPTLTAGPVTLRELSLADVDDMTLACRDADIARWTTVPSPYETEHALAFIERRIGSVVDDESPRWGIEVDGRWAGNISLRPDGAGLADVGYLVAPWARGRGVGTLALWLACDWGFREGGIQVITWHAVAGNEASRRMVEKVGFRVYSEIARLRVMHRGERTDVWMADLLPEDLVPLDAVLP